MQQIKKSGGRGRVREWGGEKREAGMVSMATGKQNQDDPVEGRGRSALVQEKNQNGLNNIEDDLVTARGDGGWEAARKG